MIRNDTPHDIRGEPDHFVSEIQRSTRRFVEFDPLPYTIHESTPCGRNKCDVSRDVTYVYSMEQLRAELGSDITSNEVQDFQITEYIDEPIVQVTVNDSRVTLPPQDELVEEPGDSCHGEDPFEQEPDTFGDDPYEQPRM